MQVNVYDVIESPLISEKAMGCQEKNNQYCFRVKKSVNKVQIKRAVETIYNVKVTSVQTVNMRGKAKRTRNGIGYGTTVAWKKAVVRLKQGNKIDFV